MADSHNPYEAPAADLSGGPASAQDQFTAGMITALRDTKPWLRFLSILGFVGCGLMVLAGLGVTIGSLVITGSDQGVMAIAGIAYLIFGAVFVVPPIQMHLYANTIASAVAAPSAPAVETALTRQHRLWKTVGIMMLVVIGLYLLAIIGVVVASMVAAMSNM